MPGGFAPRFAIEAGFLILLGVGAGLADLRSIVIVGLLAGAWVLVSLFELAIWRAQSRPAARPAPPPPPEPEIDVGWGVEPDENPPQEAYPLRSDAGSTHTEEVEAYTRVGMGEADRPANEPPGERPE